jgi:aminopeptidase N
MKKAMNSTKKYVRKSTLWVCPLLLTLPLLLSANDSISQPKVNPMHEAKTATPQPIFLSEYRPSAFLQKEIKLTFDLDDHRTHVTSQMQLYRNPASNAASPNLVLNGEEMRLISVKVDGRTLTPEEYILDDTTLTIKKLPSEFLLEIENEINPKNNLALDGLYKSGTIFCTQNEPEGFRKITYSLDRSDVMSKYTTKIIADKKLYPILLSNGNEIGRGTLPNDKHWVEWQDPFLKPSYLFALVAGDLGCIQDKFTTASGRNVDLRIYCDKGN